MQWAGVECGWYWGCPMFPYKTEIGNLNVIPQPRRSQDIQAHPFY